MNKKEQKPCTCCISWWKLWIFLAIGLTIFFPIIYFINSEMRRLGRLWEIRPNIEVIVFYIIYVLFVGAVCYIKRNG